MRRKVLCTRGGIVGLQAVTKAARPTLWHLFHRDEDLLARSLKMERLKGIGFHSGFTESSNPLKQTFKTCIRASRYTSGGRVLMRVVSEISGHLKQEMI